MTEKERDSTRLSVRVTPRASANAVQGYADGVLTVRLTAPPVEGAANQACCAFVAELLGVKVAQVEVLSGRKSRNKVLQIRGLPSDVVRQRLMQGSG